MGRGGGSSHSHSSGRSGSFSSHSHSSGRSSSFSSHSRSSGHSGSFSSSPFHSRHSFSSSSRSYGSGSFGYNSSPASYGTDYRPSRRRGGRRLRSLLLLGAMLLSFAVIGVISSTDHSSGSYAQPELSRTAVETVVPYNSDCVVDEIHWLNNADKLGRDLEKFYDLTGCQPYLILRSYDASMKTDADREAWARQFYDENFADAPNTLMYVYFCDKADEGKGNDVIWVGPESVKVFDSEVQDLFWDTLDRLWTSWDTNDNDGMYRTVFMDTAQSVIHPAAATDSSTEADGFVIPIGNSGKKIAVSDTMGKVLLCVVLSGGVLVYCLAARRKEDAEAEEDFLSYGSYAASDAGADSVVNPSPATPIHEEAPIQSQASPENAYTQWSSGSAVATAPEEDGYTRTDVEKY